MRVTRQGQLRLELGFVKLLLDLEFKGVTRQKRRRGQPVERGGGGHQHHIGALGVVALLDAPKRGQPLTDQVLVRREGVVGQSFPIREHHAAQIGCKKHQLVHQPLGIGRVGGDDGGDLARLFFALGQLSQQHGIGRSGGAGQGETFAGNQARQLHGDGDQKSKTPPAKKEGGEKIVRRPNCRRAKRLGQWFKTMTLMPDWGASHRPTMDSHVKHPRLSPFSCLGSLCWHGQPRGHSPAQAIPNVVGSAHGHAHFAGACGGAAVVQWLGDFVAGR